MSSESPAVIIYSSDGIETAVVNGNAIPANTRGVLSAGSDGTNARFVTVDTSGRQVFVGAGTAGTPVGNVVTIQGITSGTPVIVSGTVTAANASVSTTGTTVPGSATLIGGSVTTAAPGYVTGQMSGLSLNLAGGLRVDPSGVTSPVSIASSVTVAQATAASLNATVVQATAANLNATVVGLGVAGTPSGGVLTVQGSGSGTAIPVSGTVAVSGNVATTSAKSTIGTLSTVVASASSVTLLASNANRLGASFFNDSTAILYIALSATAASTTAFTIKILPGSYYDLPILYTGQINGISASAIGNIRITEFS